MTFPPLRMMLPSLALVMLAVAGCGSSSSSEALVPTARPTSTSAADTTQPTTPPTAVVTGSVAAVVNGHDVPMRRFKLLLNLEQRQSAGQGSVPVKTQAQRVFQEVIYDELIQEYANTHHITVTSAELQKQKQQDELSSGGEAGLKQRLGQLGISLSDYDMLVRPNLLAQKVEQKIAPLKPARSDAAAHALAVKLLAEIKHGANFAKLAKQYSDDPGSKVRGGDLGTVSPHQMVPSFDKASFSAPLHTPLIVKSQYGYHIIEVLSRGKSKVKSPSTGKKVSSNQEVAHVRHILISTQSTASTAEQQTQRAKFLAWLRVQQQHATVKKIAKVAG